MNIEEDDISDDDEVMNEDDDAREQRRQTRSKANAPELKYMEILRQVSNRTENEITIELDDLAKVGALESPGWIVADLGQYDQNLEENGTPLNLVSSIETNAKHYLDIMSKAVDNAMPPPDREVK